LSWLLNPQKPHGLADRFLRIFLKAVAKKAGSQGLVTPSVVEFDTWDLTDTDVSPELGNIDTLIHSADYRFSCAIENKIWSKEHSHQLQRYGAIVERPFPGRNFYVYLTPLADQPSDNNYVNLTTPTLSVCLEGHIELSNTQVIKSANNLGA
jgi:hypothetical protein